MTVYNSFVLENLSDSDYCVLISRNWDSSYYLNSAGKYVADIKDAAIYTKQTLPDFSNWVCLLGNPPTIQKIKDSFLDRLTQ